MAAVKVLDTNIVIYHLEGRLTSPLEGADYCVSVISEIELLSHDRLDRQAESTIRSFLTAITVMELTQQIKETTIDLRRRHHLTMPDAIIAATALSLNAELLTNDRKLASVPRLPCRTLDVKNA